MINIVSKTESFSKDYSNEKLPALFVKNPDAASSIATEWLISDPDEKLSSLIQQSKQTLLISADKLHEKFVETIQQVVDKKGLRVYLCLGDKNSNHQVIDKLKDRCLVRYGVRQQGSLWLSDVGTLHRIGLIELGNYQVSLNAQQLDDSYRSFCKLFWQAASHQVDANGEEKSKPIEQTIITNHSYHQPNGLTDHLGDHSASILLQTTDNHGVEISVDSCAKVIASRELTDLVTKQVGEEQQIALTDKQLPTVSSGAGKAWLLPPNTNAHKANWALELTGKQAIELTKELERAYRQADWQVEYAATVGQLVNSELLFADALSAKPINCLPDCDIELQDHYCDSFNEFLQASASDLAAKHLKLQKDKLAETVHYTVKVHPPYLPSNASIDPLINEWQKTEQCWQAELDRLSAKSESLRSKQIELKNGPFKKFIIHFVIGQKQKLKEIVAQITELKAWQPSTSTPATRIEKAEAIANLANTLASMGKQTYSEQERAEAEQAWQNKRDDLESEVTNAGKLVKKAQTELNAEQQSIESAIKEAKLDAEKKIDKLIADDHDKKWPDETAFPALAEKLKDKKAKKQWPELKEVVDIASKEINKLKSRLNILQSNADNAKTFFENAKKQLADHGEHFSASIVSSDHLDKQLGNKPEKAFTITWPSEELPSQGFELFKDKNERYLVITSYDDVEQGNKDAKRLNATLCVKQQGDN